MRTLRPEQRRRRQLALAGLLWAIGLFAAAAVAGALLPPARGSGSLGPSASSEVGRLPMLSESSAKSRVDARLSEVAGALAGIGTLVYCWSEQDWRKNVDEFARRLQLPRLGAWGAYTSQMPPPSLLTAGGPHVINLDPNICAQLTKLGHPYVSLRGDQADAFAWSVAAFAHETRHVSGILKEAQAECYGMQTIQTAAERLGRTPAEGRYLALRYWRRWYRWIDGEYASPQCRNNGRLDLNPDTDVWP